MRGWKWCVFPGSFVNRDGNANLFSLARGFGVFSPFPFSITQISNSFKAGKMRGSGWLPLCQEQNSIKPLLPAAGRSCLLPVCAHAVPGTGASQSFPVLHETMGFNICSTLRSCGFPLIYSRDQTHSLAGQGSAFCSGRWTSSI